MPHKPSHVINSPTVNKFAIFTAVTHFTDLEKMASLWSKAKKVKKKVNFEIYIADRKATACI